jgi:hypothetical protein
MNAALAGRMVTWSILIVITYGLLIVGVGRFLAWLGRKYPPPPLEDKMDRLETFHKHLDKCAQCRSNPFALCHTGAVLLQLTSTAASHKAVVRAIHDDANSASLEELEAAETILTMLEQRRIHGDE